MKFTWFRTVLPIACLFSFRMLGLFMLIPVFTIYATKLTHATPVLIGVALGSYGLSQGLLQIPFGMLSDRLGRKPMLTIGFILFTIGSLLGALTTSIYGMILARTIQGMGAVGSVLIALLADLTPDEQRTKSMAMIGATIGLSFTVAMVVSPGLTHYFGLSGIFYLTGILGVLGLILLYTAIPAPAKEMFHADSEANPALFKSAMTNMQLLRLDAGIFCQHFILTATFFVVPILLNRLIQAGLLSHTWAFYLPLMLFSFLAMLPIIIWAERSHKIKYVFMMCIAIFIPLQIAFIFVQFTWFSLWMCLFIYFVAFNILEATLPSLVSKLAPPASKGTATGIYSSSQFLGIFCGGICSGIVYSQYGQTGIFLMNAMISFLWLIISLKLRLNVYLVNRLLSYPGTSLDEKELTQQLMLISGVKRVACAQDEGVIYVQIDKAKYQFGTLEKTLKKLSNNEDC